MAPPRKHPDGGKARTLYVGADADRVLDEVAVAYRGGNRSMALAVVADAFDALTRLYEPPLTRAERLLVASAMNGVRLFARASEWWKDVLGNVGASVDNAEDLLAEGEGDEETVAAFRALYEKLRALPKHELVLLAMWTVRFWEAAGRREDVEPLLGAA